MNNILKTSSIPALLCDFYKISHRAQYPTGTEVIYSTLTPRTNKYAPKVDGKPIDQVVVLGFQYLIKKYLIDFFNDNFFNVPIEQVLNQYKTFIKNTLGVEDNGDHLKELHELGYLPLRIKAIPEGEAVGIKVPVMTIENTHHKFYWLTNYFETLISCTTWQPMTSASISLAYRKIFEKYSEETCDNNNHIMFQGHDFSMRGMSSLESAELSGLGHLVSFVGTDTIPAITAAEKYYKADGLVGTSIPATEHSVMSSHGLDDKKTFEFLLDLYSTGFLSVVSDTYDFWNVVENVLPSLKDKILNREGKLVIRPDSGDPVEIICGVDLSEAFNFNSLKEAFNYYVNSPVFGPKYCVINEDIYLVTSTNIFEPSFKLVTNEPYVKGLIQCLYETFGGYINDKGYKVLDPHIGAIYGDSITLERAEQILSRLKEKGFASSNIVLGIGSYTYQMNTRDTFGFAIKATSAIINGKEVPIFKDPKTDSGMKKSQKGRVKVLNSETFVDNLSKGQDEGGKLELVFENGQLVKEYSFDDVRRNNRMN